VNTTTSTNNVVHRLLLLGIAASSAAVVVACASCSTPGSDAGVDAATDAGVVVRDASADVGLDASTAAMCDASFWDGGVISDWPGFRRLTEFSPCCHLDIVTDASTLTQMTWTACDNGTSGCQQWAAPSGDWFADTLQVSRRPDGTPALLETTLNVGGTTFESPIYDLNTSATVGGWRVDTLSGCFADLNPAGPNLGFFGCTDAYAPCFGASGSFGSLPAALKALTVPQPVGGLQTSAASSTRFAFDIQPYGWIEQWPFDSGTVIQSSNTTGAALLFDFIEGDDVYARSVHGATGWSQEYRVAGDGSVMLFRSKDNTHIESMTTDGTTLAWCEAYGASTPTNQQPTVEVWTAPYTNDPAILAATAKKLTPLPTAVWCGLGIAFQGYYAARINATYDTVDVVRLADGATQQVAAGPGWLFGQLGLVSSTEFLSEVGLIKGGGARFARYTLGAWP
jgi:hypothetical protein